jgi:hypothetical protein
MTDRDYTPYQRRIIQRYYDNQGPVQLQRLAELVTELYLAEGKKQDRLWKSAATAMEKLKVAPSRIAHLLAKKNPALVAELVKELQATERQ